MGLEDTEGVGQATFERMFGQILRIIMTEWVGMCTNREQMEMKKHPSTWLQPSHPPLGGTWFEFAELPRPMFEQ